MADQALDADTDRKSRCIVTQFVLHGDAQVSQRIVRVILIGIQRADMELGLAQGIAAHRSAVLELGAAVAQVQID